MNSPSNGVSSAPLRSLARARYARLMPELEQRGFLRLPIDPELRLATGRIFALADEFFARPAADKQRFSRPAWVEGYRELGPEYSQVPERPDLTESFSAWNRNRARPELALWAAGCPLHGALREASDLLDGMMRALFAAMADHFAAARGGPELAFRNGTYIQLNHYEPARHARALLQDPHEDGHLVTLVQTNAPGLEIEIDGRFVPAQTAEDELLLMPGSLLSLMTGYRMKPLYHQVRNSRRAERRSSLLYFVNPEIEQVLAPWVANERNRGIDIIACANAAPKQFGMPTLVDSLAGQAQTRRFEPPLAGAAE
jgi:isopenicillin N synthase-like dioxygenase